MRKKLEENKYRILLVLFSISLVSSLILSLDSSGGFCLPDSGCGTVQKSSYAYTFGIKNSLYGTAIFSILVILTVMHFYFPTRKKKIMIETSIIIGSLIALYFIILQQFVIQEYCKYCLAVDLSLIIALILLILTWKKS